MPQTMIQCHKQPPPHSYFQDLYMSFLLVWAKLVLLVDKALYRTDRMALELPHWWAPEGQEGAKQLIETEGICLQRQMQLRSLPLLWWKVSHNAVLVT